MFSRRQQLRATQTALETAENGFRLDFLHVRARRGLPIEVLNSMDRLVNSRLEFISALADYNQAQFQLFVALGQNPLAGGLKK